eukprot:9440276-Prorocentrum_lima.AAC.1
MVRESGGQDTITQNCNDYMHKHDGALMQDDLAGSQAQADQDTAGAYGEVPSGSAQAEEQVVGQTTHSEWQ